MKRKVLLFPGGLVLDSNLLDQFLWAPSLPQFLMLWFLKDCLPVGNLGFTHGLLEMLHGWCDVTTATNCMVDLSPLHRGCLCPLLCFF